MNIQDPQRLALLLIDMQNDFLHPDGAYARGGVIAPMMAPLPKRLASVAAATRAAGGWVVSTHFTLVPGKGDVPLIAPHLQKLRPFLGPGDFAPGSIGHDVLAVLEPVDIKVEKVAYDAFYMSRLDFVLDRAGVDTLICGGIVTNGGVASTVHGAHVRDYHTIVLEDGCAAHSEAAHTAALGSLRTISEVASCDTVTQRLAGAA